MSEREKQYLYLTTEVAKMIGRDVTPERIARVIYLSNIEGYLFHGIKRCTDLERIKKEGILPKTPEGGMVSWWTTGSRIFWSSPGPLRGYDTTFFHYGYSGEESMNIAVANRHVLDKLGRISFKSDSDVTINFPVPPEAIHILQVVEKTAVSAQALEQEMFKLIEKTLATELLHLPKL